MKAIFHQINIDFRKNTHIPALDGIRGIAMLTVILYHFFLFPYAAWYSIDSFFVLSGFLITGILVDTKASKNYFKNYIARRMLRILPLYYGVLIVAFVIIPLVVNKSSLAPYSIYYQNQTSFWTYLQNWFLLLKEPQLKGSGRIFLHLWSLAVEEQFYIVWPLLVLIFNIKNLVRVIIAIIVCSVTLKCYLFFAGYAWQYTYFNTFCRLDALCIGALIAIAVRNKTMAAKLEKIVPYIFKILLIVVLTAIALVRPTAPKDQFLEPFGTTVVAVFFASLILYCMSSHKNNLIKRVLELRIFLFFGRYSYSMYIFHVPILALLRPAIFQYLQKHISHSIAFMAANLICFISVIAISQFTWYLIEKPALKLKRFFKYEIKKPDTVTYHTSVVNQDSFISNNAINNN
jgi:peptidoglycan/LPS O-acetylase OafA/YrhL